MLSSLKDVEKVRDKGFLIRKRLLFLMAVKLYSHCNIQTRSLTNVNSKAVL